MAKNRDQPESTEPQRTPTAATLRKLDRQIVELLNERAAAALRLAEAKADESGAATPQLPAEALAGDDKAIVAGPLSAAAVQAVFRELHSGIQEASRPIRVAYLGPEFTYSHLAAIARFGQSATLSPVTTIAAVFEEVERRQVDFGVVPIENSTDGRVADALECLGSTSSQICGEVPLRIQHCLLGAGTRAEIRRVCSKVQPLSQCRKWLVAHLPGVELVETASTAEAAQRAATDPHTAAIAGRQAGVRYGLDVLAANIADNPDNITRFAVIGSHAGPRTGQDKTALVFEAPHKPGALADAMAIFKRARLNLTWIESFPVPQARGRYLFFLEFQGHPEEVRPRRAIAALTKKSLRLVVLGAYAEAEVVV